MKKVLKFLSVFVLLFLLAACDNTEVVDDDNGQNNGDQVVSKYVVSFETFGGTSISSIEVEEGKTFNVSSVDEPTKDDHEFSYWSLTADGPKVDDNLVISKDLKLYAVYNREVYKITIKDEFDGVIDVIDVFSNETPKYTYKLPKKEGYVYEFLGYSLSKDKTNLMNELPKALKDETYYIFFSEEVIKYDVVFDTLGGSVIEKETLEHNAKLEEPTKPTKEGHKFINWAYDVNGSEIVKFPLQVTKDLKLFAIFEKEVYEVTIKDQEDNVLKVLNVLYNETPNYEYELPKLYGYTYEFLGYSLKKDGSNLFESLPKAVKHEVYYLIIKEEKVKYQVSFDTLGGSVINSQTISYQDYLNEPTKPTKDGYVFVNWVYNTTTNEVVEFPLQVTKDLKLFAVWNEEVEIKEYLAALLDGFKLNPYSYIPESLRKDNNIVAYNENDFSSYLNVSEINYGFGEQWNMVLNNLDQSEVFFNVLNVVDSLASTSIALFNNYVDKTLMMLITLSLKKAFIV